MEEAGGDLRVALVMSKAGISVDDAQSALTDNGHVVEKAVASCTTLDGDARE
jgi:N-acetylmuramic acid 6-phosphate (MurNAc-6-P) etherase